MKRVKLLHSMAFQDLEDKVNEYLEEQESSQLGFEFHLIDIKYLNVFEGDYIISAMILYEIK